MIAGFGQGFAKISHKKKKKTRSKGASIALYTFTLGILTVYSVLYGVGTTEMLVQMGNVDSFLHLVAVGAPGMTLLFGVMQAIPILYHESSIESLLVLPVKPSVIIAGKVTQAFIPMLLLPMLLFFPALIAHGVITGRPWAFFIQTIPFMIFVTFAPFALITIFVMILMRYTKFARDKDRFQMVTSIIAIVLVLGFVFYSSTQGSDNGIPGSSMFLPDGSAPALQGALRFMPASALGTLMLARADSWHTLLYGLGAFAINAAIFGVLLLLSSRLYIPGVLGMKAAGKQAKSLTLKQQTRALAPQSAYRSIVSKEWKLLLRTPAFFTQTVLSATLLPVMMIGIIIFTLIRMEKTGGFDFSLIALIRLWAGTDLWKESLWIIVMVASGAAALFSGTNMMSSTAISRQGELFSYSKLMPVPIHIQVFAWLTPGLTTMTVIWLILSVSSTLFLHASWMFGLLIFVTAWVNAFVIQIVSFYADMVFPVLDWTNEIQAVKNTRGAMVSSLGMFVYIGFVIGVGFLAHALAGGHSLVTAASMFLFALTIAIIATFLVTQRARKMFNVIDI